MIRARVGNRWSLGESLLCRKRAGDLRCLRQRERAQLFAHLFQPDDDGLHLDSADTDAAEEETQLHPENFHSERPLESNQLGGQVRLICRTAGDKESRGYMEFVEIQNQALEVLVEYGKPFAT